jgi:hypothetical protein
MTARGLGRVASFDPQNLNYMITDVVPPHSEDVRRALGASRGAPAAPVEWSSVYFWDSAWWGDQGETPMCTAYALSHTMADGPVTHPKHNPLVDPATLYEAIVARDRAAGRVYDGGATSLAMAQEAQSRGWIGEYRWGYSLADFVAGIRVGPVILGIDWYTGMDTPSTEGVIRATGTVRGGHEIEANGADFAHGLVRLKQSWGRAFGKRGHVYLPFADLERLIASGGDCVLVRELPTPAKAAA